jgi:23S rRNA-/tRNA-specific pseudouridylate synthase
VSAPAEAFWSAVPFGPGVRKVGLDANGLAALDKPEGVLSHPNGPRDESRSLVVAHYDEDAECFEWEGPRAERRRLWLINRLDSATSGLILAATGADLAREVKNQFQRRQIRKVYQALVFGVPRKPTETWKDLLSVGKTGGQIRTVAGRGSLPAESTVSLVRAGTGKRRLSLIQLEPHTGRSHQLRVQCAKRGLPIVGDRTYGNFGANREFTRAGGAKRMFLHSLQVSFEYDFECARHSFSAEAPLPPEFAQFE